MQPDEPKEKTEIPTATLDVDSLVRSGEAKCVKKKYPEAYSDFKLAGSEEWMSACRTDYRTICLEAAKKYGNEKDAIYYFTLEMKKVEYEVTESDVREIKQYFESAVCIAAPSYTIKLFQSNREITGKITQNSLVTYKCYQGSEEVKNCKWNVVINGVQYNNKSDFTPQVENKVIKVQCYINGRLVKEKKIECEIKKGPSGGAM